MAMPPRGHPMHPEMIDRYGWPPAPYEPRAPMPTPEQLAAAAAKEHALQEAVQKAVPAIRRLFDDFIARMQTIPTIPIADATSDKVTVKRWGRQSGSRRRRNLIGDGWFVRTRHVGVSWSSPSGQAPDDAVGLAVSTMGEVFEATPPNRFEMETRGADIAASLGLLAFHTHHTALWDADMAAEMVDVLTELLDLTAAKPVGLDTR